jgi:hypothetical protein
MAVNRWDVEGSTKLEDQLGERATPESVAKAVQHVTSNLDYDEARELARKIYLEFADRTLMALEDTLRFRGARLKELHELRESWDAGK